MDNHSENLAQVANYDYVIAGAGCAGLSLLYYLLQSPVLSSKKILVIDKTFTKGNDRTWCFWEQGVGVFEDLVCKQWNTISIHATNTESFLPTHPFTYKMIQGQDFYAYVMSEAKQKSNIYWQEATITNIETQGNKAFIKWEGGSAIAEKVFSSLLSVDQLQKISKHIKDVPFLWQHFKGRLVEFEQAVFDETTARLMDFNVDQKGATGFMYVLPLDSKSALIEYTLFSKNICSENEYDSELDIYLELNYPKLRYSIKHIELGAIPMTQQVMAKSKDPIYVIGTLGNAVKASSGYAFAFIQEQVSQIVAQLEKGDNINTEVHTTRHQFYDAVLLYILANNKMKGSEIFSRIFAKNKAATIFKFLSNTSSVAEDIKIMRSLPTQIFLPAALKVLFRRA
jgi:lycopene beta-cyclase